MDEHYEGWELAFELLDDEKYEFAWDTIESIDNYGKAHGSITPKQRQALLNIKHGADDREDDSSKELYW